MIPQKMAFDDKRIGLWLTNHTSCTYLVREQARDYSGPSSDCKTKLPHLEMILENCMVKEYKEKYTKIPKDNFMKFCILKWRSQHANFSPAMQICVRSYVSFFIPWNPCEDLLFPREANGKNYHTGSGVTDMDNAICLQGGTVNGVIYKNTEKNRFTFENWKQRISFAVIREFVFLIVN